MTSIDSWKPLHRDHEPVACCTVEQLMRTEGLHVVARGRRVPITTPEVAAARPADLISRQFHAPAPNPLWVADFSNASAAASPPPCHINHT